MEKQNENPEAIRIRKINDGLSRQRKEHEESMRASILHWQRALGFVPTDLRKL